MIYICYTDKLANAEDSFVLDTACSSSLYGLHLACTALEAGECDAAIVAAANLIQSPEQQIATMKAGVLSPTGTCHTFNSSADGYGRGDGVGALYLKKLSKAIQDGDPIRSVIRGTAVNRSVYILSVSSVAHRQQQRQDVGHHPPKCYRSRSSDQESISESWTERQDG